jgi:TIR domain-containing protein
MDKSEALRLLRSGETRVFNKYREENPMWIPDLSGEDLSTCIFNLNPVPDLRGAILVGSQLPENVKGYSRNGSPMPLKDAIIDRATSGPTLDFLVSLGARYATQAELAEVQKAAATQIFISYAWANSTVVHTIDHWLRRKGLDTKIDKRDFFAGSKIRDEITRLMQESDVVLVFHSAESADKPWVEFERELVGDMQMSAK